MPGPRLFLCAAIHGDEINGVEIIRRVLAMRGLRRLRGTLLAVPVVNVYGFAAQSRYLPDRRDLNRAFPGLQQGSLASRLAHIFMKEIVEQCDLGIDLHTGALHRSNLPQLRACLDRDRTAELADVFGVPVVLHANVRDGSLRQAVVERGMPMLLYEAGEALRFDEVCIRAGVRGIINVMRAIGMLAGGKPRDADKPMTCTKTKWERAPGGGILRPQVALGQRVSVGQALAKLSDPVGENEREVLSSVEGIVIGRTICRWSTKATRSSISRCATSHSWSRTASQRFMLIWIRTFRRCRASRRFRRRGRLRRASVYSLQDHDLVGCFWQPARHGERAQRAIAR